MNDPNDARYRSNDYDDRELELAGTRNDPLAELARLIGQNDPFAYLRASARPVAPRSEQDSDTRYSDWRDQRTAPAATYQEPASHSIAPGSQYHDQRYIADPHNRGISADARSEHPEQAAPPAGDDTAVDQHEDTAAVQEIADEEFEDDPLVEDDYEDPPRRKRIGMVGVALVTLGCVAVGVASAFAYRAYLNLPSKSGPPPVIRASAEPTKVAPPAAPKTDAAKLSYDRVGDRSQNEQVVAHEEKPIDPKNLVTVTPAPPPAPPAAAPPAAAPVAPQTTPAPHASANPPSVLTEPKRVRTVVVKPDQPDAVAQPQMVGPAQTPNQATAMFPAAPASTPAAPPPAVSATPAPSPASPAASAPPAPVADEPAAAPKPATRTAATTPTSTRSVTRNAPLSLSPTGSTPATTSRSVRAAQPPTRVASAPTAPKATPAARTRGYMVQVASQRSEADAQTSFRSIRSKYASVLGSGEPVIRRADLGAKGVYYRAMVGPYATRDEAVRVCANLKAAGGSCVVQGN